MSPITKISDTNQPVFAIGTRRCWLWDSSTTPPRWCRRADFQWAPKILHWYTHWHPDQPEAPTAVPDSAQPAPVAVGGEGETHLSLKVGDVLDIAVRLYSVVGVHLGAVGQDSIVELRPLDASRAPYHTGSKNAFVPLAMLALLNQEKECAQKWREYYRSTYGHPWESRNRNYTGL